MAIFNEISSGGCITGGKNVPVKQQCLGLSKWERVKPNRQSPNHGATSHPNGERIRRFAYIPSITVCSSNL